MHCYFEEGDKTLWGFSMSRKLLAVLRYLFWQVRAKLSPNAYARSLGVKLGKNVHFYAMRPAMFSTEPWLITIGDNVYITAGCQFITHDGGTLILRKEVPDLELTAPISIGNDVYIGLNATILPGVRIGNRVIIGAGSIVAKDIPDNSVAVGVPARVVKTVDEYLANAKVRSLHFGHLGAREKEKALRRYFGKE
jgi:acetyltransferase-like isoleucine patch superfamily enzyme